MADTPGAGLVIHAGTARPDEAELMLVRPEGAEEPSVVYSRVARRSLAVPGAHVVKSLGGRWSWR